MTRAVTLREKLEELALSVVTDALDTGKALEMKEKTTALKTAADVYELLHKQDASGKGESAYDGYRKLLAETTPHTERGVGKRSRNGSGPYRNAEAGE